MSEDQPREMRYAAAVLLLAGLLVTGCDDEQREVDPTPEKQGGAPSDEFEDDDISAAERQVI